MDTEKPKPTIVIDVDNTLIDTAVRKQKALKLYHNIDASLEDIRRDYYLTPIIGSPSAFSQRFLECLTNEDTITKCEAPAFTGAAETVGLFQKNGFDVVFITARPSRLQQVTISELARNGILCKQGDLLMPSSDVAGDFKKETLRKLHSERQLITVIGDRPEDVQAAQEIGLPAILFASTLPHPEVEGLRRKAMSGLVVCASWPEIAAAAEKLRSGSTLMAKLRELFAAQYGSWLRDIDEKARTVVIIAAILVAFSGNALREQKNHDFGWWFLLLALISSTLSTVYAIRAFTARYASGELSTEPVRTRIKQWIAIFLGYQSSWSHLPGDAIEEYKNLRHSPENQQASAHLKFFYETYQTHNPDALLNLRMMELRATNYSKLYAERIASKLLLISVVLLLIWAVSDAWTHFAR